MLSVEVRDSLCLQCHENSSANEIDKNGIACKVAHSSIQLLLVLVRHLYVLGQEKGCTGQLLHKGPAQANKQYFQLCRMVD